MKQKVISNFLLLILYIAFYFLLRNLFFKWIIYVDLLIIVLITALHPKLNEQFKSWLDDHLDLFSSPIEKYLKLLLVKLNSISKYHDLLDEYYVTFNQIMPEPVWAFYVLEQKNYLLNEFKIKNPDQKLPLELSFPSDIISADAIHLEQESAESEQLFSLYKADLRVLIPVKGKNQKIALLFMSKENYIYLRKNVSKYLLKKVILGCGQALENAALYLDVLTRNLEIKKLFEVSEKLLSSYQTDEILNFILDALDDIVAYDASVIFLLDPATGELLKKTARGYSSSPGDISLKIGQGACGWVAENKQPSLIDDVRFAEFYYPLRPQTKSQVALPLIMHNEVYGVICLESDDIGNYTKDSLEILNIFANQAALALHNAKQYEITLAKKSLEHELINAGNVQQVLLPKRIPKHEKLSISFTNYPSKIVSGDLYDIVTGENDNFGLAIGDVSGKGAGAAIMMSLVLAGFRALNKSHFMVCEVIAKLNNLLFESISAQRYASFFYGMFITRQDKLIFTNAGHNPPVLLRSNGEIETLSGGGIILGFLENETFIQKEISFNSGDILVLYTDGVTEAMNLDDKEFGEEKLISVIKENKDLSPQEIQNVIYNEVKKFAGKRIHNDDITMMVVKHK